MTHMDNTLKRRDLILKNMYKDGMITESEYDQALAYIKKAQAIGAEDKDKAI